MNLNPLGFFTGPGDLTTKAIVAGGMFLAGMALLWGLYWTVIGGPRDNQIKAAQAHTSAVVASADAANAKDASNTVAGQAASEAGADALTQRNANAISHADGASAPVAPSVALAGRLSLCRREAYRQRADCVALLRSHPG